MFALFGRAHANINLSPAERAILRLVEGLAITILVAGSQVAIQQLALGAVHWQDTAHTALIAGLVAAGLALLKYVKAHGDSPLSAPAAQLLQAGITQIEKDNDLKEPLVAPDFVNDPLPAGVPDPTVAPSTPSAPTAVTGTAAQ